MSDNIFVIMKNVYRIYETIDALKDVSCTIKTGDRIAVMEKSGSGKSTLLHIMAGLDSPTEGTVFWPDLGNRETLCPKNIGFLSQQNSLFSSLSVIENIELPLLFCGYASEDAHKRALEILNRMNLSIVANKMLSELSSGQPQRAAFARAVVIRPKLILADEPTGQLDHKSAKELFDFINDYAPKDPFLVANYDYIAQKTGNKSYETLLIKTAKPEIVTNKIKKIIIDYSGVIVSDINSVRKSISSNLTAVNLHSLTRLELFFGLIFTITFIVLMFVLNLKDRKRNFAILDVIGVNYKQFSSFIWSEGLTVFFGGITTGFALGFGVAYMLVRLLKGAFYPPPAHLFVPWDYIGILFILAAVSSVFVTMIMEKALHKDTISEIGKL